MNGRGDRSSAQHRPPVALTIAGSDSGGGAGIQADLKSMEAQGAFGTSAVTAITAQNTRGVESVHVLPAEEVAAQIDAVRSDFDVRGAKTGMLATRPIIETVADAVADWSTPLVVDPVMVAESGDRLLDEAAEDAYWDLIEEATIVTPNAAEAEVLTGENLDDASDSRRAGRDLVDQGANAVLVTGGHVDGDGVVDVFVTGDDVSEFVHPRVDTDATHGSGCTLSASIAARLATGASLETAVEESVAFMERAVRYAHDVGEGPGAVHHLVELREEAARHGTAETVREVVRSLTDRDFAPLLPEVGTNVVGATPFAETVSETAAVEGRVSSGVDGPVVAGDVRFGASSHVARFLLASREFDPDLRFAANVGFDEQVEAALGALDAPVVEIDRGEQPDSVQHEEESTMQWSARRAFEAADGTPAAVFDRGAVGKEPMVRLLAADAATLLSRVDAVLAEVS